MLMLKLQGIVNLCSEVQLMINIWIFQISPFVSKNCTLYFHLNLYVQYNND